MVTIEIVGEMITEVNIVTIIDIMAVARDQDRGQGHQMKEKVVDMRIKRIVEDLRVQGLSPKNINTEETPTHHIN